MEWDCTICRFFKRFTDLFIFFLLLGWKKKGTTGVFAFNDENGCSSTKCNADA